VNLEDENEPMVIISLPMSQAKELSHGMSDLLCWCNGYMAGKGGDFRYDPMGVEEVRSLNIKLKDAIGRPF
jgi:hypothetical protein